MKITLITVGKIKEKFLERPLQIQQTSQPLLQTGNHSGSGRKDPDKAGEVLETQIKEKKGERILSQIKDGSFIIALAIEGNMLDSEELARRSKLGISGISQIVFVIGGSLGLSRQVLDRADYKLSFSRMTFPHR
ncbi:MAG: 23S rRNA (pseudouridine(1915)-N(3))-methyltransferase RlmH [Hungatella sp.]